MPRHRPKAAALRSLILPGVTLLAVLAGWAALGAPGAAPAEWPHWLGPNRNGTTSEGSGYDKGAWPPGAPAWSRSIGGTGETSPIVAGGRLYTMGYHAGKDTLYCLDAATGASVWQQSYACRARGRRAIGDESAYVDGPLSTPEYDAQTHYLYTLGGDGDLNCWDTAHGGKRVWGVNLYDRFDAPQRPYTGGSGVRDYGYTTAPLVWGDWVIVETGAPQGSLVAFDKRTGGTPVGTPAWRSECGDPAGHSGGLTPMTVEGIPCAAVFTVNGLLVARLDRGQAGRTVAHYRFRPRCAASLVTPAVWKNLIILSTHLGPSDDLLEITPGAAIRRQRAPHSEVGTPIYTEGRAYKASGRLECWELNADESKMLWSGDNFSAEGTLILTGDKKLIACGNGKLALYTLDGRKLSEKPMHTGWPHPALADGRLYYKDHEGKLECWSLRK